jgi:amidase
MNESYSMPARSAAVHRLGADTVVYQMDRANLPAVRVESGDVVVVECLDAHSGLIRTPHDTPEMLDFDRINPATGPIYVEGAEPGDSLAVRIFRIEVGEQGSALVFPGEFGFLKDDPMEPFTKIAPVEDGKIIYRDDIRIPVRPMIGTFGVAPAGEPVSCLYPGDHGANMDIKDVCAGHTVYLPVFVPGALLALGDAKAVIGDGESAGAGLEIDVTVTLQVDLVKDAALPRPMIETPTEFMTCGWGMTVDGAIACAMRDMVAFVARQAGLPTSEAYNLVGMVGDVRLGNAVCVPGAARFVMPKGIFTGGISISRTSRLLA